MTVESYTTITRYFTCFIFSFFTYQFITSVFNFSKHNIKSSLWHSLMCLTTALYCFVFAFNTHFFNQNLSDSLLTVFWILAYISYYCYIKAIEAYFNRDIKPLKFSKLYCLFLVSTHFINTLSIIFFKHNFLFVENLNQQTLFARTMHFTVSPNLFSLSLGGFGALVVFYTSYIIWGELKRTGSDERMLQVGIIVSVLCVLNDSILGLEISGALIPLYYLGNAFEAIRLNLHYQTLAYEKINKLEGEVNKLASVAQFSYAAANISHDIKNHLMILKGQFNRLNKKYADDDNILKAQKYIDQISEITKIYSNLFKQNDHLKVTKQNVLQIVNDAIELNIDRIQKAKIDIKLNIPDNLFANCNAIALTLCLVNLIGNAIEEISAKENPWIHINYNQSNHQLEIIDSGKGIPSHIASKIFEVSYSTKKTKGGSGLGLTISKQLIQKSGMDLFLIPNSTNTTFIISLSK
ncbi:GHKL domain protein [Bacteriovorax sp. BSW11_IV]|uniref:sensor histidine kinase n=1 Tax=Bacteriovorax sp. BSW11_IV TaxID=1353529 RepID=UPI000389E6AD|nr:HAMP domain-containing sensor histidine kinase [Bacteriovorax sp. BSW11_IV]EQC44975.1 GHKL domain protein [Bacteriovorax sp. BSW11_IV]